MSVTEVNQVVITRSSRSVTYGTIAITEFDYAVTSKRSDDVIVSLEFSGQNLTVTAPPEFTVTGGLTVSGRISGFRTAKFATIASNDRVNAFTVQAEIRIVPASEEFREADLEGMIWITKIGSLGNLCII